MSGFKVLVDNGPAFSQRNEARKAIVADFLVFLQKLDSRMPGVKWNELMQLVDLMNKIDWERTYR